MLCWCPVERLTVLALLSLALGALSLALLGSSSIVSGFLEKALSLPGFAAGQLILVFSAASGSASVFLIVWTCLTAAARRLRAAGLVALVYGGLAALGSVVFMVNVSSIKGGKLAPLVGLMFCAGVAVFILGVAVILLGCRVLKASRGNCRKILARAKPLPKKKYLDLQQRKRFITPTATRSAY